jgi:hypothetical protein
MYDMFQNVNVSTGNYDVMLISWAIAVKNGVLIKRNLGFSGGNSKYCNSLEARNYLINECRWIITDSGLECKK